MTKKNGQMLQFNQPFVPLSHKADQLASQLEQALNDPRATEEVFFRALDRYSSVLKSLEQQRGLSTSPIVKH